MASSINTAQKTIDPMFSSKAYQEVALQHHLPQSGHLTFAQFEELTDAITERVLGQLINPGEQVKDYVNTVVQGNIKMKYRVALSDRQRTPEANFFPTIISTIKTLIWT